jgi:hypothetical protein
VALLSSRSFPHRKNDDGTYDSICTECFQTVATFEHEHELKQAEEIHRCKSLDPHPVVRVREPRRI